ncbi:MAG: hypothetical protein FWE70_03790, partial [Oscillospiraceae bacterium]|nr:hypothetical protein [Oscillospiraceae bacterium]
MYDWAGNEEMTDIVEMVKATGNGDMTITLAGAHAKGLEDGMSDIDVYVYYADPKPHEEIKAIVEGFADDGWAIVTKDHVSEHVGGFYIFKRKGVYVEVTTRLYERALDRVRETLEGRFEILPAQNWTFNGYYTFTYASEISIVIPMWDPPRFIERTRATLFPYPRALKESIIRRFGGMMNQFANHWEYSRNAVERRDLLYTSHFVTKAVLNMVQVVFALNEAYYTGDKQVARKMAALPYVPAGLIENLPFLLGAPDDRDALARQRDTLHAIIKEVTEKSAAAMGGEPANEGGSAFG